MSSFKSIYEQARQLIIWLGLVELAWLAWWLLQPGGQPTEFVGLVNSTPSRLPTLLFCWTSG